MPFIMGPDGHNGHFRVPQPAQNPAIYAIYYGILGFMADIAGSNVAQEPHNLCNLLWDPDGHSGHFRIRLAARILQFMPFIMGSFDLWRTLLGPFWRRTLIIYAIYYGIPGFHGFGQNPMKILQFMPFIMGS